MFGMAGNMFSESAGTLLGASTRETIGIEKRQKNLAGFRNERSASGGKFATDADSVMSGKTHMQNQGGKAVKLTLKGYKDFISSVDDGIQGMMEGFRASTMTANPKAAADAKETLLAKIKADEQVAKDSGDTRKIKKAASDKEKTMKMIQGIEFTGGKVESQMMPSLYEDFEVAGIGKPSGAQVASAATKGANRKAPPSKGTEGAAIAGSRGQSTVQTMELQITTICQVCKHKQESKVVRGSRVVAGADE
jgi:hypothetical protein